MRGLDAAGRHLVAAAEIGDAKAPCGRQVGSRVKCAGELTRRPHGAWRIRSYGTTLIATTGSFITRFTGATPGDLRPASKKFQ